MEIENEKSDLENLKIEYEKLSKKYKLPDFDKLAEDFDIEKIVEKETSFVLRDMRRMINEKLSAYLHFFEVLMNPSSPPMFVFSMLKNLNEQDHQIIKKIYAKIAKYQIVVMKLDTIYNEKNEANFILTTFNDFQDMKIKINEILEKLGKDIDLNNSADKKGYFG